MRKSPFSGYASYNLRADFWRDPDNDINCCFACPGTLSRTDIAPSRAVTDELSSDPASMHYRSRLFTCASCGWWCIRELWSLLDLGRDGYIERDCLIVGANEGPAREHRSDECEPWISALNNPDVYRDAPAPPREVARLLLGLIETLRGQTRADQGAPVSDDGGEAAGVEWSEAPWPLRTRPPSPD